MAPTRGIRPSAGPADWHGIVDVKRWVLYPSGLLAGMTAGHHFLLSAQVLLAIILGGMTLTLCASFILYVAVQAKLGGSGSKGKGADSLIRFRQLRLFLTCLVSRNCSRRLAAVSAFWHTGSLCQNRAFLECAYFFQCQEPWQQAARLICRSLRWRGKKNLSLSLSLSGCPCSSS